MRTAGRVVLDQWGRAELACLIESSDAPAELQRRARIIELAAGGASDAEIAQGLGISRKTASRWRRQYLKNGLDGLRVSTERRAPRRAIPAETVELVVRRTQQERPARGGGWSSRAMAALTGVSEASVRRIWREHNIRPHLPRGPVNGRAADWELHGLFLEPGTRLLVLAREQAGEAGLPALSSEGRGSRAALLLRLLVARSGSVAAGSGEAGLRRFLGEAVAGLRERDVLVAVEATTAGETGRIRALVQSAIPAARLLDVASHVEWVQLLESSVARLERGAAGDILAAFGGRIQSYLENGETSFQWARIAGAPKARSAQQS